MSVSSQHLQLINAVLVEASIDPCGVSLSRATRRLFELVEAGEYDFETLKASVLEPRQQIEHR